MASATTEHNISLTRSQEKFCCQKQAAQLHNDVYSVASLPLANIPMPQTPSLTPPPAAEPHWAGSGRKWPTEMARVRI